MPGNNRVTRLTGQRRPRHMTWPILEIFPGNAFPHDPVEFYCRNQNSSKGLARYRNRLWKERRNDDGRIGRVRRISRIGRDRNPGGGQFFDRGFKDRIELPVGFNLGAIGGNRRPEQLIRQEREDEDPGPDHGPSGSSQQFHTAANLSPSRVITGR